MTGKEVRVDIDELKQRAESLANSMQLPNDIRAKRNREKFVDLVSGAWELSVDMNNQIKMKGIDIRISAALTDWYSTHLVTVIAPVKWRTEVKKFIREAYLKAYPETITEERGEVVTQSKSFRTVVIDYLGLDELSDLDELEEQIQQGIDYYNKYESRISKNEMGFMLTSDWESIPGELEDIDHYYLEERESKNGITLYDKFRK